MQIKFRIVSEDDERWNASGPDEGSIKASEPDDDSIKAIKAIILEKEKLYGKPPKDLKVTIHSIGTYDI